MEYTWDMHASQDTRLRHSQNLEKDFDKIRTLSIDNFEPAYPIEKAILDPNSSVYSLPETPVLPYFKDFPVVLGQKFTFSCLGKKTYEEALQIIPDLLEPMDTVYIHMPEDGNPLPMTALSLEELKLVVCSKISSESQPIISEGNLNAFNALVSDAEAGGTDVLANTRLVYDFVLVSIIANLAANVNAL